MRKFLMTITAVLCCTMTMNVLTSCISKDEIKSKLIGTWTEQNDLFTNVLTLDEEAHFTFQTHITELSGSGSYIYEYYDNGDKMVVASKRLILIYSGKARQSLQVHKLTGSTLQMSDSYGHTFHFKK